MIRSSPTRGEIWWVDLDPTKGSEIQKTRPAVVISSPAFDHLPVRIVVPLTTWQAKFLRQANKMLIPHSSVNGLPNDSAADFLQIRSVALERFGARIGALEAKLVEELAAGVVVAVDYSPQRRDLG